MPALLALVLGFFTFRNRIRGVYFTILTQALVIITMTLFVGQQAYTGGTNGITGLQQSIRLFASRARIRRGGLYLGNGRGVCSARSCLCRYLVESRFGKVLRAIRDGENRVRFIGYNPAIYQMAVFTFPPRFAGLAGMLFVLHVGIISPSMMGIVPSIEMVLWVAIGGRGTLIGAVIGAVLINSAKSVQRVVSRVSGRFSSAALFVVVVVFLPKGAGGTVRPIQAFGRRKAGVMKEHDGTSTSCSVTR